MPISIADELMKLSEIMPNFRDEEEVQSYFKKYAIALVCVMIAVSIIYKMSYEPASKIWESYYYLIIVILPIIIGAFLISPVFSKPLDKNGMFFYGALLLILIISIYLFYHALNPTSVLYMTYLLDIILFLAVIVGLAIIYRIFVRYIINLKGWGGFLLKVLFYFPCLLIDLMETLFVELKNSPKIVVVLFVLEILIILAYLNLPKMTRAMVPGDMKVLLNKPVFLTKSIIVANGQDLIMPMNDVNNPGHEDNKFRNNYAISMWIYLNHNPSSYAAYSKETDIFRYGETGGKSGHPRVSYFNDASGGNPDQCIVYVSNVTDSKGALPKITTRIKAQTWNHLVINYAESDVDLFLNGNLVQSMKLSSDQYPTFSMSDVVQVGYGDNSATNGGLMGAICNIKYHYRALMPIEIAGAYNLNMYSNPPIYDANAP